MRILITADTVGGVWDYALALTRGLSESGHRVLLAVIGSPREELSRTLPDDVELEFGDYRLEWMPGSGADVFAASEWLNGLAHGWNADLVHLNQMAYTERTFSAPTVVVAHSDVLSWFGEVKGASPGPGWEDYRRRVSLGLKGATSVVSPTHYQSALLGKHFGRRADRVIWNGVQLPGQLQSPQRREFILAAGRAWDEAKGMAVLDRALELLGSDAPAAHLLGALDGPAGEVFHPRTIQCHGRVARAEVESWMRHAALFVAPSLYEPFGLAPAEAAMNGCALVLSDIGSFRELWDGCAAFFPAGDAEALAGILDSLSRNPSARESLARAAHRRATEQFTVSRFLKSYLNLYSELLSGICGAGAEGPQMMLPGQQP